MQMYKTNKRQECLEEKEGSERRKRVQYNAYFELNDEPYDSTVRIFLFICRSLMERCSISDVDRVSFN